MLLDTAGNATASPDDAVIGRFVYLIGTWYFGFIQLQKRAGGISPATAKFKNRGLALHIRLKYLVDALKSALVGAFVFGMASSATAGIFYVYEGNNFNTFEDSTSIAGEYDFTHRLSGWVELITPLPTNLVNADISSFILDFRFTDGRLAIDRNNFVTAGFNQFFTDASGNVTAWTFVLRSGALQSSGDRRHSIISFASLAFPNLSSDSGQIEECINSGISVCSDVLLDQGFTQALGAWTVSDTKPAIVPLPAALPLLGSAIAFLGLVGWQRRRGAAA